MSGLTFTLTLTIADAPADPSSSRAKVTGANAATAIIAKATITSRFMLFAPHEQGSADRRQ
jgi:hypothetical protein